MKKYMIKRKNTIRRQTDSVSYRTDVKDIKRENKQETLI